MVVLTHRKKDLLKQQDHLQLKSKLNGPKIKFRFNFKFQLNILFCKTFKKSIKKL